MKDSNIGVIPHPLCTHFFALYKWKGKTESASVDIRINSKQNESCSDGMTFARDQRFIKNWVCAWLVIVNCIGCRHQWEIKDRSNDNGNGLYGQIFDLYEPVPQKYCHMTLRINKDSEWVEEMSLTFDTLTVFMCPHSFIQLQNNTALSHVH